MTVIKIGFVWMETQMNGILCFMGQIVWAAKG